MPVLLQKVGIAVTGKTALTVADAKNAALHAVSLRYLQLTNIRLVIPQTLVLPGVLGSQLDRHARCRCHVDHGLVHSLGMHVDFDFAAAPRNCFKQRLPEWIATLGDPALPVHSQG